MGKIHVTVISCAPSAMPLQLGVMDDEPWQARAKRAGLTQKRLARLLGVSENTVSLQLRGKWASGIPTYVKSFIRAYEMLPQVSREELDRAVDGED